MDSFTTKNRSTYDIDLDASRVRRTVNMGGEPPPPNRPDGVWHTFVEVRPWRWLDNKVSLLFVWEIVDDVAISTVTGPVIMATRRVQNILDECRD